MDLINDLLEFLEYDFATFLKRISDFFTVIREEVMNDEMTGLVLYLYGCFPSFLRDFMFVVIILAVVLGLIETFRKD